MRAAPATGGGPQANWMDALAADGLAHIPGVLTAAEIAALVRALDGAPLSESIRRKSGTYAIRNLLEVVPEIARLATGPELQSIVEPVLGPRAFAVRGILFDKTPGANWKVPLHQDLTIAVVRRIELPGFGPWSLKAGTLHVQPPAEVLERMLSVRLHLDECDTLNGPLRVIYRTHLQGRLTSSAIDVLRRSGKITECMAAAGDALVMRPLLVHASSPSRRPGHRRVVHLDFAAGPLPGGLEWALSALQG